MNTAYELEEKEIETLLKRNEITAACACNTLNGYCTSIKLMLKPMPTNIAPIDVKPFEIEIVHAEDGLHLFVVK